jgi:mannose-6-phosphate isomerase-like protein (cupin superfamily)
MNKKTGHFTFFLTSILGSALMFLEPTFAFNANKPETKHLPEQYDYLAPDGSEIRLLPEFKGGSTAHCILPAGKISGAMYHKSVDEIWFVLEGEGEIWRRDHEGNESVTALKKDMTITVPVNTHYQFRALGNSALKFFIVTLPPWPGSSEAVPIKPYWSHS